MIGDGSVSSHVNVIADVKRLVLAKINLFRLSA